MNLSDQVCSLELAKRLCELGVKQDSLFYWNDDYLIMSIDLPILSGTKYYLKTCGYNGMFEKISSLYSAFTAAELGEMLLEFSNKNTSNIQLDFYHTYHGYNVEIKRARATELANFIIRNHKESDLRAHTLIWLIENGHVKV